MFLENSIFNVKNNTLIIIDGNDKYKFIQGIISNDIKILKKKKSIYSSILTPQGRFIHDFFITTWNGYFFLECSKNDSEEILKKLNLYKLRSDVKFKVETSFKIYLANYSILEKSTSSFKTKILFFQDPRFKSELTRIYVKEKDSPEFIKNLTLLNEKEFNDFRLKKSIPDFNVDALKNKSLLLEMRFDQLNGISWEKGCYMGQEITARMKYRNITKKKLYSVYINFKSKLNEQILSKNIEIGQLFKTIIFFLIFVVMQMVFLCNSIIHQFFLHHWFQTPSLLFL